MKEELLEQLFKHMQVFELDKEIEKQILEVENPPYPECLLSPVSSLDFLQAQEDLREELLCLSRQHNRDKEKTKKTVKCVLKMPAIFTFTNHDDESNWIVQVESNPHRMMELYHRRHGKITK